MGREINPYPIIWYHSYFTIYLVQFSLFFISEWS
uniref:Uncharacterized protein n=1 Tax=Myoviridae sp. ctIty1 TaxID=2827673 RepID=A0A8S5THR4_9CAUD|nr:MAG TPA: hypothetical protein [Myoviridae sp. ctIty1]